MFSRVRAFFSERFSRAPSFDRVSDILIRHRGAFAFLLVVGIFALGHRTHAAWGFPDEESMINSIYSIIGEFLSMVIKFMGGVIILLTDILIAFAGYKNFVNAPAVVTGWILVRDVVNMFFIVVLLLSAFSTIIHYEEFNYKKVLPKLLLMAVVINFSKTLIGLLIDFSQVLMLTFVNAFRQAAGGNMVTVLKLDKVTRMHESIAKEGQGYALLNLLPAAFLAIFMLGISMTVLVIMVGFLVARIIGLWLLLILSPAAFFVSALPSSVQSAFKGFSSDYWGKLSTFLVAGPVMAFFLWLTLAIVQATPDSPFGDVYRETSESASAVQTFVTAVGDSGQLSSFIISIALLLSGVEFAMSSANAASKGLGKLAGKVAGGGGVAVQASRLALRLGGKGVKVGLGAGAWAGKGAFNAVDSLANIRGGVGTVGLAVSRNIGGIGGATMAGLAGYKSSKIQEKREAQNKALKNLAPEDRARFLRGIESTPIPFMGKAREAARLNIADEATTRIGMSSRTKALEADLKNSRKDLKEENERKAVAEAMASQEAGTDIKTAIAVATKMGDAKKVDDYKEALKKNPSLHGDFSDFADAKGASMDDSKKFLEDKKADAWKDSRAFLAHMYAMKMVKDDGSFLSEEEINAGDDQQKKDAWKKLNTGKRGDYVKEHMKFYQANQEGAAAQLAAMDGSATKEQKALAEKSRYFVTDKGGKIFGVRMGGDDFTISREEDPSSRFRREIDDGRTKIETARRRGTQDSEDVVNTRHDMNSKYAARYTESHDFNAGTGTFQDQSSADAFDRHVGYNRSKIQRLGDMDEGERRKALDELGNMDTQTLAANPDGRNDARSTAVNRFETQTLKNGHQAAVQASHQQAKRKIEDMVGIMAQEGKRMEGMIDGLVNQQHLTNQEGDILKRGAGGGFNQGQIDGAKTTAREHGMTDQQLAALDKASEIQQDEQLREIATVVGERVQEIQRAAAAAQARVRAGGRMRETLGGGLRDRRRQRDENRARRADRRGGAGAP